MNLSQLQTAVQARGYGPDTASQQVEFLNRIYREVCGMQKWPFLEKQDTSLVTAYGTGVYSLASITDLLNLDAVRLTLGLNFYNLDYWPTQQIRDKEHTDRTPDTPLKWSWLGQQLHLWPLPNGVYSITIDYIYMPPALVSASDTPVLPAVYHDILVDGAVSRMAERERDWVTRDEATGQKETLIKRMQQDYLLRQRQSVSHVRKAYWGS